MDGSEGGGGGGFYWRVLVRQALVAEPLCDVIAQYGHNLSLEEVWTSVHTTYVPESKRDGLRPHSVTGHTARYVVHAVACRWDGCIDRERQRRLTR